MSLCAAGPVKGGNPKRFIIKGFTRAGHLLARASCKRVERISVPIYAYRCASCGFEQDALQKMSDAPLKTCPQCGADALQKQVTAAGFQLKGSGWYATDFRNNDAKPKPKAEADAPGKSKDGEAAPAAEGAKPATDAASTTSKSDTSSSTPAPAPAASPAPAPSPSPSQPSRPDKSGR